MSRLRNQSHQDVDQRIIEAAERAVKNYGLCPHRVWAVADSQVENERALPVLFPPNDAALEDLFSTGQAYDDTTHRGCTFDFCEQSQLNFTSVAQRHESPSCRLRPCSRIKTLFPGAELNQAAIENRSTAWQLSGQRTVFSLQNYLAISHVWSGGTGAGTWSAGEVNTCLFHFFAYVARRCECDGIWWDAICMPTDRTARAKAVVNMHTNYSDARMTLVYDCFLRNLTYRDAETACIAILMSPWFSRGWAAVELASSRSVLVAFQSPPGEVTLIDLDDIISNPKSPRHKLAADAISGLRTGQVTDLDRLLTILGSRYTSWTKDVPIISALLAGAEIQPNEAVQHDKNQNNVFQQDIYRNVITKIQRIGHGHLFHNLPTVVNGTSWCPARLLDLPTSPTPTFLVADKHGNLVGTWVVLPISNIPRQLLSFEDAHPLVQVKSRLALDDPQHHRFLVEPGRHSPGRAVLAKLIEGADGQWRFQFVGSVVVESSFVLDQNTAPQQVVIIYGNETEDATRCSSDGLDGAIGPPSIHRSPSAAEFGHSEQVIILDPPGAKAAGKMPARNHAESYGPLFSAADRTFRLQRPGTIPGEIVPPFGDDIEYGFLPKVSDCVVDTDPSAALLHMAKAGDANRLKYHLHHQLEKWNPLVSDKSGRTPLSWASGEGHTSATVVLLDSFRFHSFPESVLENPEYRGREVSPVDNHARAFRKYCNRMDEDGRTPLAWAAAEGRLDTIIALLRYPDVVVDARDRAGWTALWYAVNNTNLDVMDYLMRAGADKNLKDMDARTLVEKVAAHGTTCAMKWLLRAPVNINSVNFGLIDAAYNGRVDMMHLLIEAGASINFGGNHETTPIKAAIIYGHDNAVKMLLETGQVDLEPDPTQNEKDEGSLLTMALSYKNSIWEALNDPRANVNGYLPIVQLLIETGRMDLEAALRAAASQGDAVVVDMLLEAGELDVNARGSGYGATAIYNASAKGHKRVVDRLLQIENIDISLAATFAEPGKYRKGHSCQQTPLQAADENGFPEVAAMLRRHSRRKKMLALRKWVGSS